MAILHIWISVHRSEPDQFSSNVTWKIYNFFKWLTFSQSKAVPSLMLSHYTGIFVLFKHNDILEKVVTKAN
jgi:hypothetical protein